MREDQSDLMLAQARSDLAGGVNRAKGRDAKNTRDLDAEMRKRRLAKNALLAVRKAGLYCNYRMLAAILGICQASREDGPPGDGDIS